MSGEKAAEAPAASPAREARADLAWIAALLVLTRLPDLFSHYRDWDEAAMMSEAWAMTRGQALYRDIPQFHPILNFAVFLPFFAWLKPAAAPHAIKGLNALLTLGGAWLTRRLALLWTRDRDCAIAAALLFVALLGRDWSLSSYGEFYLLFPVLLAAVLLQARSPRWLFVGLLWGTAFFFKQVAAFDAAALTSAVLLTRRRPAGESARSLAAAAAGGAMVLAAASCYFAWNGILADAARSTFLRPFDYRALPGLSFWRRASLFREHMLVPVVHAFWPCGILGAGAIAAAAWSRVRKAPRGIMEPLLLCLAWFVGDLLGIWFVGKMNFHYAMVLIPSACLLAVLCLRAAPPRFRTFARRGLAAFLFFAAAMQSAPRLRDLIAHGGTDAEVDVSARLSAFARTHTRDDDRIFLYGIRNLDVFYLSERLSSNGVYMFIDMEAPHMHDEALEARLRRDLLDHPPALIIADLAARLPGSSSGARDFISALIRERYGPLAALGATVIYGLKSPAAR
jgi:hypothetical protein